MDVAASQSVDSAPWVPPAPAAAAAAAGLPAAEGLPAPSAPPPRAFSILHGTAFAQQSGNYNPTPAMGSHISRRPATLSFRLG